MTALARVVKFGGVLLETPPAMAGAVVAVRALAAAGPLVVVHGGGKEIDAALKAAGIDKQQVDGLRITDEPTLAIVVSVVAGAINTRFVAALTAAGVPAVGLTGADAHCGLSEPAPPHQAVDGRQVALGSVGIPSARADMGVLRTLTAAGFVPVVACIGVTAEGRLLNVNADTLAGHLAAQLHVRRLVIAGTTPGVLASDGSTLPLVDTADIARLVGDGTATAGMIAKLRAVEQALTAGVEDVVIVDGRDPAVLEAAGIDGEPRAATRLVRSANVELGR